MYSKILQIIHKINDNGQTETSILWRLGNIFLQSSFVVCCTNIIFVAVFISNLSSEQCIHKV